MELKKEYDINKLYGLMIAVENSNVIKNNTSNNEYRSLLYLLLSFNILNVEYFKCDNIGTLYNT
jgi:hypothetical protein